MKIWYSAASIAFAMSLLVIASVASRASPVAQGETIGQLGGASYAVSASGNTAIVGVGPRLIALDITIPEHPVEIGQGPIFKQFIRDVVIDGDYAYVAVDFEGIYTFDISNAIEPKQLTFQQVSGRPWRIALDEDNLYLTAGPGGLHIFDRRFPERLTPLGHFQTDESALDVSVADKIAYVTDGNSSSWAATGSLYILDVSAPHAPVKRSRSNYDHPVRAVAVADSLAHLAISSQFVVMDVSKPDSPGWLSSTRLETGDGIDTGWSLEVEEGLVYVLGTGGYSSPAGSNNPQDQTSFGPTTLYVYEVTSPQQPVLAGITDLPAWGNNMVVDGSAMLAACANGGVQLVDISAPTSPRISGRYTTLVETHNLSAADPYVYIASGYYGLQVVDASNARDMSRIGSAAGLDFMNQVEVVGDYAYTGQGVAGMGIYAIADPTHPTHVNQVASANVLNDFTLYRSSEDQPLLAYLAESDYFRIIDVTDPLQPAELGRISAQSQTFMGVAVQGDRAYTTGSVYGGDGFHVLDISSPSDPRIIDSYPGSYRHIVVDGDYAYVDELYTAIVTLNISGSPWQVGAYPLNDSVQSLMQSGAYLYVSLTNQGINVLSLANPAQLDLYAHYQTPSYTRAASPGDGVVYVADGSLFSVSFAIPADPPFLRHEAEEGTLVPNMKIGLEESASACGFISTDSYGSGRYDVRVPVYGQYYLWLRVRGLSHAENSFSVMMDDGAPHTLNIPPVDGRWQWLWMRLEPYTLHSGTHVLTVERRERNARFDTAILSPDPAYNPSYDPAGIFSCPPTPSPTATPSRYNLPMFLHGYG